MENAVPDEKIISGGVTILHEPRKRGQIRSEICWLSCLMITKPHCLSSSNEEVIGYGDHNSSKDIPHFESSLKSVRSLLMSFSFSTSA